LAFRTEKLGEYQSATKDHTNKKEKLQQVRESGKPVTPAMETDLQKAVQLEQEKKVIFETTSTNVRAEVERFLTLKSKELQSAVSRLIQINLTYELRVVDLWKKFLSALPEEAE
jgi:serine/threonine protein phosphatase PrpC